LSRGGIRYCHCTHRGNWSNRPLEPHEQCDAPWVRVDWLEGVVWTQVATLFRDPTRLREELVRRREEGSPTRTTAEAELARVRKRLAAIPAEQDRAFHKHIQGKVPDDVYDRAMAAMQQERQAAEGRIGALERELAALAVSQRQETNALEYAASIAAGLDVLDDEGRQRFLRDMLREVRVDGRRVTITTILPGGPDGGSGNKGFVPLLPSPLGRPVDADRLLQHRRARVGQQPAVLGVNEVDGDFQVRRCQGGAAPARTTVDRAVHRKAGGAPDNGPRILPRSRRTS